MVPGATAPGASAEAALGGVPVPKSRASAPRRWSPRAWMADLRDPSWLVRFEAVLVAIPWILLAIPLVLGGALADAQEVIRSAVTGRDVATADVVGVGLVVVTGVWVHVGHTRIDPRDRTTRGTAVYLAGLLVLTVGLIQHDDLYVIFAITGLLHSYHLHPWPFSAAGVLAASVVVHGSSLPADPSGRTIGTIVTIVLVQSAAIVAGYVLSDKERAHHARRAATVRELAAALAENERLHVLLVEQARRAGVVDERRRLAGEIHDTLAQGLTGIVTQVQAAQRVWEDPARARPHVDRALDLARESLGEARRSVRALHPAELVDSRLPEALADLAGRWSADNGVRVGCEVTGTPAVLPPATEIALFRTAQESLTNVARHANASRVGLTLSYLDGTVLLDVRDDGVGFAVPSAVRRAEGTGTRHRPADAVVESVVEPERGGPDRADGDGGFGLAGMRRRLAGVGGELTVESAPGEGTAISARVAVDLHDLRAV